MRSVMTIDAAAIRLTDTILGHDELDLEQALKAIAANVGLLHTAYVPLCSQKSGSASFFVLVGLIGRLVDKRAYKKTWIGLPGQARGFLRSSGTAIVG